MEQTIHFTYKVLSEQQGCYFRIPFEVPEGISRLDVEYGYPRRKTITEESTGKEYTAEINIIDLALENAAKGYLGSSGSDRSHLWIQEAGSSRGYASVEPSPGAWNIILGACKVQPGGVEVNYTIHFTLKERQLFFGDTHMHTTGSDGALTCAQLADYARYSKLDFMIVTDHNNYTQNAELPALEGITAIPGMEWTHYKGHSGFWGLSRPIKNPFCINSRQEMQRILEEAKNNGAVVVLNHPLCNHCGWKWGLEDIPYDLLEIWNGGNPPSILQKSIDWWQRLLCEGHHLRITGGSDFHGPESFHSIGLPTMGVYADSNSASDLLKALKNGSSYIVYGRKGPALYAEAAGHILGETAPAGSEVKCRFTGLAAGDELHTITDTQRYIEHCTRDGETITLRRSAGKALFMRFEVYRPSLTGYRNPVPCLVSNPIFFK